jgi:hypothetical protein
MRLDAANLTDRFLATGAALCRPAEPDHHLPARRRDEEDD